MIHLFSTLALSFLLGAHTPTLHPSVKSATRQDSKKYTLSRKYVANEKLTYFVRGQLNAEQQTYPVKTFIPEDLEINYRFTILVKKLKADGIAAVNYKRPTMNFIEGETAVSEPKTTVIKDDDNLDLDASPVN